MKLTARGSNAIYHIAMSILHELAHGHDAKVPMSITMTFVRGTGWAQLTVEDEKGVTITQLRDGLTRSGAVTYMEVEL